MSEVQYENDLESAVYGWGRSACGEKERESAQWLCLMLLMLSCPLTA